MSKDKSSSARFVVVVVEDEVLVRLAAAAALTDAGFEVVEAEHADEAVLLLQARAQKVHAMFTDVHVPGTMDGMALAHLARRSWPWIAVLIASGRAQPRPEDLPEGSRFLPKPYDPDHVVNHLREMVAV